LNFDGEICLVTNVNEIFSLKKKKKKEYVDEPHTHESIHNQLCPPSSGGMSFARLACLSLSLSLAFCLEVNTYKSVSNHPILSFFFFFWLGNEAAGERDVLRSLLSLCCAALGFDLFDLDWRRQQCFLSSSSSSSSNSCWHESIVPEGRRRRSSFIFCL
jgi:hypothetical protein